MDELKACPFCGSHNVKMFYDERQNYHVECYGCNKTVSFHIVEKSSHAKAIEIYNRRPAPENKPLTNLQGLFGTSEKIADILLPLLPTMDGFCKYCNHWVDGECKVNPHWDCKSALVNWLNQPYVHKPEEGRDES